MLVAAETLVFSPAESFGVFAQMGFGVRSGSGLGFGMVPRLLGMPGCRLVEIFWVFHIEPTRQKKSTQRGRYSNQAAGPLEPSGKVPFNLQAILGGLSIRSKHQPNNQGRAN